MRKIIIASHGELATGILNTLSMIVGDKYVKNIETFSLYPGEDAADLVNKLETKLNKDDEYIILTDILGGSVDNAFSTLLLNENVYLISGVNLLLLLEIVLNEHPDTELVCLTAVENARKGINFRKELVLTAEDEEF